MFSRLTSAEQAWQFQAHHAAQEGQHNGNKVAACDCTHLHKPDRKGLQ